VEGVWGAEKEGAAGAAAETGAEVGAGAEGTDDVEVGAEVGAGAEGSDDVEVEPQGGKRLTGVSWVKPMGMRSGGQPLLCTLSQMSAHMSSAKGHFLAERLIQPEKPLVWSLAASLKKKHLVSSYNMLKE
jgi:hypothetical protein